MDTLFHITGHDIAQLGDDDLRELVGMLCESDYRAAGLRTTGITWGGNQDAADGGLDVVVQDNFEPPESSSIPRKYTGFQVKRPKMVASDILMEMKPRGKLRDSIKDLIKEHGAYIIVSSQASTAHSALKNRKEAMRLAVSEVSDHENLFIDFYTCDRIATWVRLHPSLILWVRNKIGRPLAGWQPYGNWSNSKTEANISYILDEGIRLYSDRVLGDNGQNPVEAINSLRQKLSHPKTCIRLIGLSGVGKTRFIQALFDEQIGINALASNKAIYTDISHNPSPDPVNFAKTLIANKSNV